MGISTLSMPPPGLSSWRFEADSGLETTGAVADGIVYIASEFGTLYAVDAVTGTELWRFATPVSLISTPMVVDGSLYVGSDDGNLYAIDPATGAEDAGVSSRPVRSAARRPLATG